MTREGFTKPPRIRIFYGWWIVLSGGLVQGYASAVFFRGFQAFFDPIVATFGWSRAATAAAVSIQRLENGALSPIVGTLIDRFGPRPVMSVGVAVTGGAFILMSRSSTLWEFYLSTVLLAMGLSFGTFVVLVATVGNWFIRRRALALAILMSASAIGGLTLPILVSSISHFGWRDVLMAIGFVFWLIGFPVMLTMRRRPELYGMLPDGASAVMRAGAGRSGSRLHREANLTFKQVVRLRFFWQFAAAASIGQLVSSTSVLHLPALRDFGVDPGLAALAAGSIAIGDFFGRISIGFIGERVDKRRVFAGAFTLMAIGTLSLSAVDANIFGLVLPKWVTLPMFAIGFGGGFGASIPLRLAMLADYFGRRSYGTLVGATSAVSAVFGAVGPVFVGATFDISGGYRPAFVILSAVAAAAIPVALTLERPQRVAARARYSARRAHARAHGGDD